MRRYTLYFLCFVILILGVGCSSKSQTPRDKLSGAVAAPQCEAPNILVAGECCTDANGNSICDQYESREITSEDDISLEQETEPIEETEETRQPEKQANLTIKDVHDRISNAFSTNKTLYTFKIQERGNVTDFENLFEVYESSPTRMYIWKIKKIYNYLYYYNNFSDFIRRSFDLDVRNNNVLVKEEIDYYQLYEPDWIDANYTYEPTFEEETVQGKKVLYESHLILIYSYDNALFAHIFPVVSVWCTPDVIVRMYPPRLTDFTWSSIQVEDAKRTLDREMYIYRRGLITDAEKAVAACS